MHKNIYRKVLSAVSSLSGSSYGQQQDIMSVWRPLSKYGVIIVLCILFNLGASVPVHATTVPKKDLQTPVQLLKKSLAAMKLLKSFSFQTGLLGTITGPDIKGILSSTSVTMTSTGVWVKPDQVQIQLTLKSSSPPQTVTLSEVMVGHKLYVQNAQGGWYILDAPSSGAFDSPFFGTSLEGDNKFSNIVDKVVIKDDGTTILNGVSVRHLTITLDKTTLQDLITVLAQSLPNVTVKNAAIDVWINNATTYVQSFQLQFELATPSTSSSKPSIQDISINMTIDYSRFDDSTLKVIVPAKALPFPTKSVAKTAK